MLRNMSLFKQALLAISAITLTFPLFWSCNHSRPKYSPPRFCLERTGKFEIISQPLLWNRTNGIHIYDNFLAVIAYKQHEGTATWVHLFNKDGKALGDFVVAGRGPLELTQVEWIVYHDRYMELYSKLGRKKIVVDLSTLANNPQKAITEEKLDISNDVRFLYPTYGENILSYNLLAPSKKELSRLLLLNVQGDTLSSDSWTPYEDDNLKVRFLMCAYSETAISPDSRHFAIASRKGAILEMYSLSDNNITRESVEYYIKPDIAMSGNSLISSENEISGFNFLYARNNYLLTAYDGETRIKDKSNLKFKKIAVFDWEGKAWLLVRTDYRIESITYDKASGIIYAIVENLKGESFIGRLSSLDLETLLP